MLALPDAGQVWRHACGVCYVNPIVRRIPRHADHCGNSADESILISADVDKDGNPDLIQITADQEVYVYINDGNGGFRSPVKTNFPSPYPVEPLPVGDAQIADLNGDGYPDLVLEFPESTVYHDPLLLVLFNQKDGTFGKQAALTVSGPDIPGLTTAIDAFAIGAATSSGAADIVTAQVHNDGTGKGNDEVLLQTFVNNGAGAFTPGSVQTFQAIAAELPVGHVAIALSDTDGDGKSDLLLEFDNETPQDYVHVLQGNGDGTFNLRPLSTVTVPASFGIGTSPGGLNVVSLTGSASRSDLVVNNGSGVYVALSNGNGTFQTPKEVTGGQFAVETHTVDLNGDGKPDLVVTGSAALISYLGNGDGTFGAIAGTGTAYDDLNYQSSISQHTVLGDFNGDGKIDFANLDYAGDIGLGLGNGDGTFAAPPLLYSGQVPVTIPRNFYGEVALDLNGDGITDLIGAGSSSFVAALGAAKGKFTYVTALPYSAYTAVSMQPVTGDFNRDGLQDVILTGTNGSAGVALSKGDGSLKTPVTVIQPPIAMACSLYGAAVGDVNGDAKADIVFTYQGDNCGAGGTAPSGYMTVLGNGDGTFRTPVFTPFGTAITPVALAGFHGKNKPLDLVIGDDGTEPSVSLLKGNGDGTFGAPVTVSSGFNVLNLLATDYDQDGNSDLTLILEPGQTQQSQILRGNGDGSFDSPVTIADSAINNNAIYADLNGDGIPDLIGDGQGGVLSVMLGSGSGQFAPPIHYLYAGYPISIFAGNFLADNTLSIIAPNGFAGGTVFFMNQGGTSLTVTPSATSITPGQSVTLNSALSATLAGQPAPTGTVTFYDGTTQIGSGGIGASISTANLAAGTHSITAVYSGDSHFNPNTSAAVAVTVATPPPPDFSFTATGSTLTIAKGSSGTLQFTVSTNASLSASASFQCSGLPRESTCSFSPANLTVGPGSSGTTTLTVQTTAASANARLRASNTVAAKWGGIVAAGLLCLVIPRRKRRWLGMVLILSLGGMVSMTGCGGGGGSATTTPTDPGTPAGSSTVTVTATAISGSSTITHTSAITLVVQ